MVDTTLTYYNKNGDALAERYEAADVSDLHVFLLNAFKPPAKLMELGCGSGRDAAFMTAHGFQVTGIDGSTAMIESALIHHPELSGRLYAVILPQGLSGTPESYDGIFSIASLMHLSRQDISTTIKKIRCLLVPRGNFFFSVPTKRDDIRQNEFDEKGRRFTALTQKGWIDLCKKHGFKLIKSITTRDGLGRPGIIWVNCLMEKAE